MKNFGARFSLYPMSDKFIPIILGALEKTDTTELYSNTDRISTVYGGSAENVVTAVENLFVSSYTEGVHTAVEGIFSNSESFDISDTTVKKEIAADFPVKCMVAVYGGEKSENIFAEFERTTQTTNEKIPYGLRLDGGVNRVWAEIKELALSLENSGEKFTLYFKMNCNSPTAE